MAEYKGLFIRKNVKSWCGHFIEFTSAKLHFSSLISEKVFCKLIFSVYKVVSSVIHYHVPLVASILFYVGMFKKPTTMTAYCHY